MAQTFVKKDLKSRALIGLVIFVAIFFISTISAVFVNVKPGTAAVKYSKFTGVSEKSWGEGLHLKIPFLEEAKIFDITTQSYSMVSTIGEGSKEGDDSLRSRTSDGQSVWLDVTVSYKLDKSKLGDIWKELGDLYVDKVVRPESRSVIRMVVADYSATELYSEKRQEVEDKIFVELEKRFTEKNLILERILLRDVTFSTEYANAIEQKQIAEQNIKKSEFELEQAKVEKQKAITQAEAEAEAIKIKGEALKQNPEVLQLTLIEKLGPDINWGILPDNITPILDLNDLNGN